MDLSASKREKGRKGTLNTIRREGHVPAVVYSKKEGSFPITVEGEGFGVAMRKLKKGHLPNTVFNLKFEDGTSMKAIVKDIQYHKVSYNILHLDFMLLHDDSPVVLNIPIQLKGVDECAGVKEGGVLRQVVRHAKVKCLPTKIPASLSIDVKTMRMKDSRRLREITFPEDVESLGVPQQVIAVVGKR